MIVEGNRPGKEPQASLPTTGLKEDQSGKTVPGQIARELPKVGEQVPAQFAPKYAVVELGGHIYRRACLPLSTEPIYAEVEKAESGWQELPREGKGLTAIEFHSVVTIVDILQPQRN